MADYGVKFHQRHTLRTQIYNRSFTHNLGQNNFRNFEFLVKKRNFGQKSKFWSKIEILVKNRNFD